MERNEIEIARMQISEATKNANQLVQAKLRPLPDNQTSEGVQDLFADKPVHKAYKSPLVK
jgi:hypothetical protein